MRRRDFLALTASTASAAVLGGCATTRDGSSSRRPGPGFATPQDAMRSPRELLLYTVGIYTGTKINAPDYLATVDVDPASKRYGQIIHRLPMPNVGDELHHFGWNACSSCHHDGTKSRRFLIVPGFASGRIHIIDVKNPEAPVMHRVIEPEEIKQKTNLSAPHTSHCLADGTIMISMLGDAEGEGPGGFLLLDERFQIMGRWERNYAGMNYNYDFWYQPRHNLMVSSEFAAPNTYSGGFDLEHVKAGKYGQHLHLWNWKERAIFKSVDLGEKGLVPLEIRFHHQPESHHGFVGAALSGVVWHIHKKVGNWGVDPVIEVPTIEAEGWPFPVPGLITDILVSMDDRFLYFSNWLHGDVRQYSIADPANPRLVGQVHVGGAVGKAAFHQGFKLTGGPQMLQQSLDGKRLYVTNSLLSAWDNQFYSNIAEKGSYMLQIDCDTEAGGMRLNDRFYLDFGKEPLGPARAHEVRLSGGDCSSDIFV